MKERKLPQLDILRIVSISIVVLLIHIPNDYAQSFYIGLDPYIGFLFHTSGINVAMGSFVFLSGFGLYLNRRNRDLNNLKSIGGFLKRRFLRIFPLYWCALTFFLLFVFPDYYSDIDLVYLVAHIFGLQMVVAPLFSPPILTVWFVGLIILYYIIYVLLSSLGSIKWMIPTAIAMLFLFAFLNITFNLFEYRFFYYYLIFIAGIVSASFYISPYYDRLKIQITRYKLIPIFSSFSISILSLVSYLALSRFCYNFFNLEYGTTFLFVILDSNPGFFESATAVLLVDLLILLFISFSLSLFHSLINFLRLLFPEKKVGLIFSLIAYSTYCVYLFHRVFLALYTSLLSDLLNLAFYERLEYVVVALIVPFIFLFSYFIQKFADWFITKLINYKHN